MKRKIGEHSILIDYATGNPYLFAIVIMRNSYEILYSLVKSFLSISYWESVKLESTPEKQKFHLLEFVDLCLSSAGLSLRSIFW